MRWLRGAAPLAIAVAVAAVLVVGSADGSPEPCTLVASPSGSDAHAGTPSRPFRTAQKLVDSLRPGQAGCLMAGSYSLAGGTRGSQLEFVHGGSSGAPLTLKSYPGQLATLTGGPVYVPAGSNYVTITGLDINSRGAREPGVQIMGANVRLTNDDITNMNTPGSCIILGSDIGYGRAVNPLVAGDIVHQCGHNPGDPFEDHGVYVDNTVGAVVTNNIFWGIPDGFGVQLYPDSQGTQVTHNVIDNNGSGVVIGGNSASASSNNTVAKNIISASARDYDIQGSWQRAVGTGNVAQGNCVFAGNQGTVESPPAGFSDIGNVTADPAFANEAAHTIAGYELQSGSACLGVVGADAAAAIATSRRGLGPAGVRSTSGGPTMSGSPTAQPLSARAP
jgi:hypothetical protein